jgi:hypothetical protein
MRKVSDAIHDLRRALLFYGIRPEEWQIAIDDTAFDVVMRIICQENQVPYEGGIIVLQGVTLDRRAKSEHEDCSTAPQASREQEDFERSA